MDGFVVSPPLASSRVAEGPRRSATDKGGLFPLTYRWRKAMPKISGGCLCGAVRYECNAEPLGTAICHCTHCQKVSGSAFSVNVVVPAPSLTWQGQSLASYADKGESGKPLSRKFCRNCGSSLATETEALPGAIIIKAGTLDDKSWLKPNFISGPTPRSHGYELSQVRRHFQKVGPKGIANSRRLTGFLPVPRSMP